MSDIPLGEFKDNASRFIAAAEAGEEIVITRHGKPAVRLVAVDAGEAKRHARVRAATAGLAQLRDQLRAEGQTASIAEIIDWKNEGRR